MPGDIRMLYIYRYSLTSIYAVESPIVMVAPSISEIDISSFSEVVRYQCCACAHSLSCQFCACALASYPGFPHTFRIVESLATRLHVPMY